LIRFAISLVGFSKGAEFAGDLFHTQSVPSGGPGSQDIFTALEGSFCHPGGGAID
jgi:hypothetical protein